MDLNTPVARLNSEPRRSASSSSINRKAPGPNPRTLLERVEFIESADPNDTDLQQRVDALRQIIEACAANASR